MALINLLAETSQRDVTPIHHQTPTKHHLILGLVESTQARLMMTDLSETTDSGSDTLIAVLGTASEPKEVDTSPQQTITSASPQSPPKIAALDFAEDEFHEYTGKASTVIRALLMAAAGLACWLAGGANAATILEHIQQAPLLRLSLICAILGLIADGGQYIYASAAYGRWRKWITELWNHRNDLEGSKDLQHIWKMLAKYNLDQKRIEEDYAKDMTSAPTLSLSNTLTLGEKITLYLQRDSLVPPEVVAWVNLFFWVKIILAAAAYIFVLVGIIF